MQLRAAQQVRPPRGADDLRRAARLQKPVQRRTGGHAGVLQPALLAPDGLVFLRDGLCLFGGDEADAIADGREPLVGVVLPVKQPVFAARGHDAVRLLRALRDEVVDEGADVAVRAFEHQRLAPEDVYKRQFLAMLQDGSLASPFDESRMQELAAYFKEAL